MFSRFTGQVFLIDAGHEVVSQLVKRSTGLAAMLDVFLKSITPIPFCDICGHGDSGSSKLTGQSELFKVGQLFRDFVDFYSKFTGRSPNLKILEVLDGCTDSWFLETCRFSAAV